MRVGKGPTAAKWSMVSCMMCARRPALKPASAVSGSGKERPVIVLVLVLIRTRVVCPCPYPHPLALPFLSSS